MTAKIKLNAASGGGSFSLQAPSSSSNNRVHSLPDVADGTVLTTTSSDADRYKAGEIVQVVTGSFTNDYSSGDFSNITSTTFVNYGNMKLTITPKFNNSKLIFETNVNNRLDDEDGLTRYELYDTTNSRVIAAEGISSHYYASTSAYPSLNIRLIGDSGYTTALVAQVRVKVSSGGGTLNTDYSAVSRYMSIMEVKQ